MARVAVVVGQDSEIRTLLAWMDFETKAWVRAHLERGFDLRYLDDHGLKMACYAELNRQRIAATAERE